MIDFDPQTINILIAVFKAVVILLGTVIFAALLSFIGALARSLWA